MYNLHKIILLYINEMFKFYFDLNFTEAIHRITSSSGHLTKVAANAINQYNAGLILGLRRANERRGYIVTTSLIGWAQA